MLYIKVFDKDLKYKNYQFEIGKIYKIFNDKFSEFYNDSMFYFYKNIKDIKNFYNNGDRFCYIEALSEIIEDGIVCGCKHIKIVKELSDIEIQKLLCQSEGNYNAINAYNFGDHNSGELNFGNFNSANDNSGNFNSGNNNSGHHNIGHYNSGDFNLTNNSSGFFCTKESKIKIFDIDSNMTYSEFINSEYYDILKSFDSFIEDNKIYDKQFIFLK